MIETVDGKMTRTNQAPRRARGRRRSQVVADDVSSCTKQAQPTDARWKRTVAETRPFAAIVRRRHGQKTERQDEPELEERVHNERVGVAPVDRAEAQAVSGSARTAARAPCP